MGRHLSAIEIYPGFEPLAARDDGFIVDLWGVLHDGVRVFPGALDCLLRLRGLGKQIVVLSNAPRRAASVAGQMAELGMDEACYSAVISSGKRRVAPYTP